MYFTAGSGTIIDVIMRTFSLKPLGGFPLAVLILVFVTLARSHAGGSVAAWGYYYDLTMPETYRPMYVPAGLTNVLSMSGGYDHALALKADGNVVAWGWSGDQAVNVPTGLSNVVSVAAGYDCSLALKSDGKIVGWGYSPGGAQNIPATLSNVVGIAVGMWHALAVKSDGTVVAWGGNLNGSASVPSGLDHVIAVGTSWLGDFSSVALKDDGTVVAWGTTPSWTNVPTSATNVVAIASGSAHCLALLADSTVMAWGVGWATNVPPGLSNVVSVAAGASHSLAVKADGTIVAWGAGTNYVADYSINKGQSIVPTGFTNAFAASGGYTFSLALLGATPPVTSTMITNLVKDATGFNLAISSQSARVYALEYKNTLSDSGWVALPLVAGNGSALILTDPTATNSQRFYRVQRW
jgi:alpha-tubulin suppressor-like RCC1 family protein